MTSATIAHRIYPAAQEVKPLGGTVRLDDMVILVAKGASSDDRGAAELLKRWVADEFLVNLPLVEKKPPRGKKSITVACVSTLKRAKVKIDVPENPEGYALSVKPGGIVAAGRDRNGTLYAVATLMQILELEKGKLTAPAVLVRDWPRLPMRYVHIYVPGSEDIAYFKRYVRDFLLRYKFNGIIMEMGGGVRIDSHPEIATGWKRTVMELYAVGERVYRVGEGVPPGPKGRFTNSIHRGIGHGAYIEPEQLRDVLAFARAHGQDVVPEIQSLCHLYYLAVPHREIAELPNALFPDAYCPRNRESYRLVFEVLDDYVGLMQPKSVHIGHDEWRAGGLCPKCRKVHTGRLFADDVIRIYRHLKSKGVGTWMWGDHFVACHNERRRSFRAKNGTWYDHPTTEGAWKKVIKACPDILVLNWSWSLKPEGVKRQGAGDADLTEKGFRFFYGNFRGHQLEDFEERVRKFKPLGAEISSWSGLVEYEMGKMHVADALTSISYLWEAGEPDKSRLIPRVCSLLNEVRSRLKGEHEPPIRITPERQHALDLSKRFNSKLARPGWDLSGIRRGRFNADGLECLIGKGAIVAKRPRMGAKRVDAGVEIPVRAKFAKLVFLQSATGAGRRPVHAGDSTFVPRESSELLGIYDVIFDDGLILEAEVRYAENVGKWDAGLVGVYYHARNIIAGKLPDGSPLVIWGHEWTNPRPDSTIRAIRFRGAAGPSKAQPMLLGITGIERVTISDYRTAAEIKRAEIVN